MINLLIKFWLSNRQMRHVALHRAKVPDAFASVIDVAASPKSRGLHHRQITRLGHWDLALDSAMLVMWTLLGGLGFIGPRVARSFRPRYVATNLPWS